MRPRCNLIVIGAFCILTGVVECRLSAGELSVVSVSPPARSLAAPVDSPIVIQFDRPVLSSTVILAQSVYVFGRWSGAVTSALSLSPDGASIIVTPARKFSAGETVMVVLSHDIQAVDESFLRSAGYSYQFWTNARHSNAVFQQIDSLSTRTIPTQDSRAYGGIGSDLNEDGYLDIAVVNEDTADLRVFLNRADGDGFFDPFLQPTFDLHDRASPSEPADFNGDGHVDICVANINTNNVSILLGNGDGTFGAQQVVSVGITPRGIAVLDVDGDGDIDIANTNASSGTVSILLNDGAGVFTNAGSFEGGGTGEWGLAAADMNNDGVLDLVVGAQSNRKIIVQLGNGDGTFTISTVQDSDGPVWMLAIGDLNGDGYEDVTTANSQFNRSAVLFGNGAGQLAVPVRYSGEVFSIATDVGDLDGDGDLDWVTSSYGGDWRVYRNNGAGVFSLLTTVNSPIAASCAVLMDSDNDGDLDMSLIDEEADVVLLMQNDGIAPAIGDVDDDCRISLLDHAVMSAALEGPGVCVAEADRTLDFNDDCDVDMADFVGFQIGFTGEVGMIEGCIP